MSRARRVIGLSVFALLALVVMTSPVAAGYDSVTERLIGELNEKLLYIAVPIAVLVESILLYTVWRFRNNDEPTPTKENKQLEITWTVATALVLLFVGTVSYSVLAHPMVTATESHHSSASGPAGDAVEVEVTGQQWVWTFTYPDANVTTRNQLVLPANRTVYLLITSDDVIHSVYVPELGLKQDAVPGVQNVLRTRITETGTYQLYCAEYCGAGHSRMRATVLVLEAEKYERWLNRRANQTIQTNASHTRVDVLDNRCC